MRHAPLIHLDRSAFRNTYPDWTRYMSEYGVQRRDLTSGLKFNQAGTAISAARSGIGLLLGRTLLIDDLMAEDALIAVAELYPTRCPYYLIRRETGTRCETLERFRHWIFDADTALTPKDRPSEPAAQLTVAQAT